MNVQQFIGEMTCGRETLRFACQCVAVSLILHDANLASRRRFWCCLFTSGVYDERIRLLISALG